LQEKLSGSQAPFLLMLSVLLVLLVLAALYESWTIPLSVLLTVPLGILGAVVAERRLFHRRHRDHHRARREGRHSDHRIRQGFARTGPLDQGRDDRSLPHALPAYRDDRPCVRLRRGADDHRGGRERQEPAGARNDRHGRDDCGGHPGAFYGPDLLRDGAGLFLSTGKAGAPIGGRGRRRRAHKRAGGKRQARIAAGTSALRTGGAFAQPRMDWRRTATISARMEIAISSGVMAPRSRPAGALSLA